MMTNNTLSFTNMMPKKITKATTPLNTPSNNFPTFPFKPSLPIRSLCGLSTSSSKMPHTQATHQQPQATNSLIFCEMDDCKDFICYLLEQENDDGFNNGILVNPRIHYLYFPDDDDDFSFIVGSCNGLVCLALNRFYREPVHVCNPVTGEYVRLPATRDCKNSCVVSGFGFDQDANEYKVIRMFNDFNDDPEFITEVHTLGSGEWRNLGYAPYPLPNVVKEQAFVNGALHWLTDEQSSILAFNVGREEFHVVPLPSEFNSSWNNWYGTHLANLGGYLCLVVCSDRQRMEIWVMKEYGVQGSWTKEFVFPKNDELFCIYPVNLTKNGNILMHVAKNYADEGLACYDPVMETFHNLKVGKTPHHGWEDIIPHARSSVSLKDIVGRTDGYLVRKILDADRERDLVNM